MRHRITRNAGCGRRLFSMTFGELMVYRTDHGSFHAVTMGREALKLRDLLSQVETAYYAPEDNSAAGWDRHNEAKYAYACGYHD